MRQRVDAVLSRLATLRTDATALLERSNARALSIQHMISDAKTEITQGSELRLAEDSLRETAGDRESGIDELLTKAKSSLSKIAATQREILFLSKIFAAA